MDTTLKTSMQLTCDKDSKVFYNMADEVGLSFNAMIFSDKLKEKHVKSSKNFPETKIGINQDSSQKWEKTGLLVDINPHAKLAFKDSQYKKQPVLIIYQVQLEIMGSLQFRLWKQPKLGL